MYLDSALGRYDAVHGGLRERIKLLVLSSHEVWLQKVATVAIVLKFPLPGKTLSPTWAVVGKFTWLSCIGRSEVWKLRETS